MVATLFIFYHSFDIAIMEPYSYANEKIWICLSRAQSTIGAPRKSFKTIMSPNSTLDGNYVIVFRKRRQHLLVFEGNIVDAEKAAVDCARKIIRANNETTSQDLYDRGMLKDAVEKGYLGLLASKYHTLVDVISPILIARKVIGGKIMYWLMDYENQEEVEKTIISLQSTLPALHHAQSRRTNISFRWEKRS